MTTWYIAAKNEGRLGSNPAFDRWTHDTIVKLDAVVVKEEALEEAITATLQDLAAALKGWFSGPAVSNDSQDGTPEENGSSSSLLPDDSGGSDQAGSDCSSSSSPPLEDLNVAGCVS